MSAILYNYIAISKRFFLIIIGCLFLINHLSGQSVQVAGIFPTIDHSGKINDKWNYSFYYFGAFPLAEIKATEPRSQDKFLLFYSEQALTFSLSSRLSFTGSYVYQRENVLQNNYVNENRIHLQATFKHQLNTVNFKHRLRMDNRFIENRITGKSAYTHRLRYLFGIDFPIKSKKNNLYFVGYEEAFFNTFSKASVFYGENWAYAALGISVNTKNKVEAGPLYITWNVGGSNWFHQYYLQVSWISQLDFTSPKKTN